MRLIVTRPEPDAGRTALALSALGHQPILSPMLDIVPGNAAAIPPGPFQAVLATSANAVRALVGLRETGAIRDLPLLAVGDSSALEAKRAGFAQARSAGGAVAELAERAAAELDPAGPPLLYAAGEAQAGDLAGRLRSLGFGVEVLVLYRAVSRPHLSPEAGDALRRNRADGVLLYSRRSAEAFAQALQTERLAPLTEAVACFCLSPAVAEPLAPVSAGPILVAERPDQIRLFALLERV